MSVDKFGLMGDEPEASVTNIIHPIHKYATNLDDLENVEGFNEDGHENDMYAFKLTNKGIYQREKIEKTTGLLLDNDGAVDRPMVLLWKNNQWLTMPSRHNWDIDIQLYGDKVSTKGENHVIHKIFNSGKMMGSLVPNKNYINYTILKFKDKKYYIHTSRPRSILSFKCEFNDERDTLLNIPDNSYIVIEGYILEVTDEFKELINGLKIKWTVKNTEFKIGIKKETDLYKVGTLPKGLQNELKADSINLKDIFVYENYYISRIRFTTSPVTEEEIMFL